MKGMYFNTMLTLNIRKLNDTFQRYHTLTCSDDFTIYPKKVAYLFVIPAYILKHYISLTAWSSNIKYFQCYLSMLLCLILNYMNYYLQNAAYVVAILCYSHQFNLDIN